jgi:hypothetical protein
VKYPITVTADGFVLRRPRVATSLIISDAWRFVLRHWGILAALAITFIVHAPTLRYFFDGDDFVVLGSINHDGTAGYLQNTVLMRDIVPNWRPLTGAVYAAEWHLFGMDAMGWRAVNLSLHLASITVLYALVVRVTRRPAIGATAAVIFGVSGAHFDTVTYVTALPHVLATGLVLASMLAIVSYVQDGERSAWAYWLAFAFFALAFLANEGHFVYAPVIVAAYALFAHRWRRAPMRLALHAAPFAILAGGWSIYYQFWASDQIKFDGYFFGSHVITNYAVYLSWLPLPIHSIPHEPSAMRWIVAGAVLAFCAFFALRGPHIARIAALGVMLALLPYVPVEIWTASRYTYAAVAFFAPIVAIAGYAIYDRVRTSHRYAAVPATLLALVLLATITSLYGWQSYAPDRRSGIATDRWQLLVNELNANYDSVPPGKTIYIVDGPWTNPMEQYTWVPSVARALYGDAAAFNLPRAAFQQDPPRDIHDAYVLEWTQEGLRPVNAEQVLAQP